MQFKKWILGLSLLSTVGCSGMSNSEKGLLGGTAAGAGAGALLTHGHPAGIVLGGLTGLFVGGVAGEAQDRREDRRAMARAYANAQVQRQMSVQEVIQLSQRNTPDPIIINQVNSSGSAFALTTNDLIDLQNHNVSPAVIAAMQVHRPRPMVLAPPAGVIYVDAPPPPPPVGVGVMISR